MDGGIVETPLSMAHLASNLRTVLPMGRMAEKRNGVLFAIQPSDEQQFLGTYRKRVEGRHRLAGPPAVAGGAGNAAFPVMVAAVPVAIDTDKAALLVDVGGEIVPLHAGGTGCGVPAGLREVRGPVFPIVVVFEAAMIVAAHTVAIVAAQTVFIGGRDKGVRDHFAAGKRQMACGASGAMGDGIIGVTVRIYMTAETATAQHVVAQGERPSRGIGYGDVGRFCHMVVSSELPANPVDCIGQGEVERTAGGSSLPRMAATTCGSHMVGMTRPGDQSRVSRADLAFVVPSSMARSAVQLMRRVKSYILMTAYATGLDRSYCACGSDGLRRGVGRFGIFGPATGQEQ